MPLKLPNLSVSNCQSFSICFNIDGSLEQAAEVIGDAAPQIRQPPDGPPAWFFGCRYTRGGEPHRLAVFARTQTPNGQHTHVTAEIRTGPDGDVAEEIRYVTEEQVFRYRRENFSQTRIAVILDALAPKHTDRQAHAHGAFRYPSDKYRLDTGWAQDGVGASPEKGPIVYGMKVQLSNGSIVEFDVDPPEGGYVTVDAAITAKLPIDPKVFDRALEILALIAGTVVSERKQEDEHAR